MKKRCAGEAWSPGGSRSVVIAIASGKGGTGKTTVAVSLALSVAARERVALLAANALKEACREYLRTMAEKPT